MNCRDLRKRRIFKEVSGDIKSKIKKILSVKTKSLNYNIFTVAYYIFTIQNTINYYLFVCMDEKLHSFSR